LLEEISVAKVKLEDNLYDRAKRAAEAAGYSSADEFIADCVEKEIKRLKVEEEEAQVSDQLRGLGYIE
jgi:metal-responsive CopG/Arc/MetJ family transcriptional regulator